MVVIPFHVDGHRSRDFVIFESFVEESFDLSKLLFQSLDVVDMNFFFKFGVNWNDLDIFS
jgi:hypothetical protein